MKYYWSINQVPFYFFLFLYFICTSLGSSLKAYFYWTSRIWCVNEVCLGNVKLISCLALRGKKFNVRCTKIILFSLKKVHAWKGIFFLFYQILIETLFYERIYLSGKSLQIALSPIKQWKHSVFSIPIHTEKKTIWLVDNFSSAQLHF